MKRIKEGMIVKTIKDGNGVRLSTTRNGRQWSSLVLENPMEDSQKIIFALIDLIAYGLKEETWESVNF